MRPKCHNYSSICAIYNTLSRNNFTLLFVTTSHLTPLQYRSDILYLPLVLIAWLVPSWLTCKMQPYSRTQSIPSVESNPI